MPASPSTPEVVQQVSDFCNRLDAYIKLRFERKDSREKGPQMIHGAGERIDTSGLTCDPVRQTPPASPLVSGKGSGISWMDAHIASQKGKSPMAHEYELERLARNAPKIDEDPGYDECAQQRARYDSTFNAIGCESPPPHQYESAASYRVRMADSLRQHSPHFKDFASFARFPTNVFDKLEPDLLKSVADEAYSPTMISEGQLVEKVRVDRAGRRYYEFYGDPRSWMDQFSIEPKKLARIHTTTDNSYRPHNVNIPNVDIP